MQSYKPRVQSEVFYWTGASSHVIIMMFMQRDEVIKRVHRQHHSLVLVVPVAVRSLLAIHSGDYVYFSWTRGGKSVRFGKVDLRKVSMDGCAKRAVRENPGRRVRATRGG